MKYPLGMFSLLLLSSCATLLQPGPDKIPVSSVPTGATVVLNGTPVGLTPMEVLVERDGRCSLEFHKLGFKTVYLEKDKVVAGWVFGNILFGGFIGIAVDLATHNQGKYSENPVAVTLFPRK